MDFLRVATYSAAIALAITITSCGVARRLPDDSYMLVRSDVAPDRKAPRDERITAAELSRYIPQSASRRFFGTNLPAWLYLQADPEDSTGGANFLRSLGSQPVILDTTMTMLGARNLKLYMNSRGFYESESDFDIRYNKRRRTARVRYTVTQNKAFRVREISYDFRDRFLEQVIREDSTSTLLSEGMIFDTNVLRDERNRIASNLQNSGYFNFSINNISFRADTTVGDHLADITMIVKQHLAGYDENGDPIMENNSLYSIRDIFVHPDYDATRAITDPSYLYKLDTVQYMGLKIVNYGSPRIKPSVLRRVINIYPDYLYSHEQVQRTYNDILNLSFYRNARILFEDAPAMEGMVTYVGGETDTETGIHTSVKQLNCTIFCTPTLRQGYTLDFETTYTSAFYGLRASASYVNRNLFKGAELLHIGVTGAYEIYGRPSEGEARKSDSYEIGTAVSIAFPRFLTPFKVDRANRAVRPQTRVELSFNKQNRPYYHRTITGGNIAYTWSNSRFSSYSLRPLDVNIVNVTYIDTVNFLDKIQNVYLRNSYKSQFVPAISAAYLYRNPAVNAKGASLTFQFGVEAAGNLTYLLASAFSERKAFADDQDNTTMAYAVFGIPFSQYVRFETSLSQSFPVLERSAVVYRLLGGIGLTYGNSFYPFDRNFFVGGATSMRGWAVRTLGPGDSQNVNTFGYASQVGNMRLEANLEFRFPLFNSFHGAVFLDAGNIWNANIRSTDESRDGVFRFDTFLPQTGLNTGIGLRYDVGVAVIRLDWGIILHDPGEPENNRWISRFSFGKTALSFGIGYPF